MKFLSYKQFTIFHLLLAVSIAALILASLVEQQSLIGRSKTVSPDGNWSLQMKLIEHSTLFSRRKTLSTTIEHATIDEWGLSQTYPLDEASGTTISNLDPHRPIIWSEDSSTVTYWINKEIEDSIKVATDGTTFTYQREWNSFRCWFTPTTVTSKPSPNGL